MTKKTVTRYSVGGTLGSAKLPVRVQVKYVTSQGRQVARSRDFEYNPKFLRTWEELTAEQQQAVADGEVHYDA